MSGPYTTNAVLQSAKYGTEFTDVYQNKRVKKMGWFDRWFMNKSKDAWENYRGQEVSRNTSFDANNGLNMTVYPADGGHVVQFNHYDHRIDRSLQSLHIIAHGEDFPDRISQIITLELIKGGKST